jgi:hypothetical protein
MMQLVSFRARNGAPSAEHPVYPLVRIWVCWCELHRTDANSTDAIVKALGRRGKLWFDFESAAGEMRVKREAAYFDASVEHGITAARLHALGGPSKTERVLADRVVRELLATAVTRSNAFGAAIVAAWAIHETRATKRPTFDSAPLF